MSETAYVKGNINDVITKRNSRIERFFRELDIPIRLIGDRNKPAIIYDNMVSLSVFAHNFNLNFTDKPHRGNIVKTIKLTHNITTTREEVVDLITTHPHQAIYNIKFANTALFLAGYNYLNRKCKDGKYPVFAKHQYKVYFKQSHTKEIIDELYKDGYMLELHKPFLNNTNNITFIEDEY